NPAPTSPIPRRFVGMTITHHIRLRGPCAAAILRQSHALPQTAFRPPILCSRAILEGGAMVRGRLTYVAAAVLAMLAIAAPAFAQITTGTLSGTVKDPQGGVIPGAAVTL